VQKVDEAVGLIAFAFEVNGNVEKVEAAFVFLVDLPEHIHLGYVYGDVLDTNAGAFVS